MDLINYFNYDEMFINKNGVSNFTLTDISFYELNIDNQKKN